MTSYYRMIFNFIVILYSIYLNMVVYQVIDGVLSEDGNYHNCNPYCSRYFRGDRNELRHTIYQKLNIAYEEYKEDGIEEEEDANETIVPVYSPFKICYVNSYIAYDSDSIEFDYTRESEYDTHEYETLLGTIHNKMYMVFDDIHIVFSIRDQMCVKYPDVIGY